MLPGPCRRHRGHRYFTQVYFGQAGSPLEETIDRHASDQIPSYVDSSTAHIEQPVHTQNDSDARRRYANAIEDGGEDYDSDPGSPRRADRRAGRHHDDQEHPEETNVDLKDLSQK